MATLNMFIELLLATHFALVSSEWIEIPQKSMKDKHDVSFMNIFNKSVTSGSAEDNGSTSPSIEWIAYQQERFNIQNMSSPRLLVDSASNLKNSARVVVPAQQPAEIDHKEAIRSSKRHIFFQTRTKIELDNKPQVENVETTIQRDISKHVMSTEDTDAAADTDDDVDPAFEAVNSEHSNLPMNPTINGFLKFIKSIQKSFLRQAGVSIERKIKILKNYRDKIMRTIENRFKMLWQPLKRNRSKRGLFDDSHLSFPPEAALISINFLTFAVFLIKLVLYTYLMTAFPLQQVIHIVKSKHYSFTGFGVNSDAASKFAMRN